MQGQPLLFTCATAATAAPICPQISAYATAMDTKPHHQLYYPITILPFYHYPLPYHHITLVPY